MILESRGSRLSLVHSAAEGVTYSLRLSKLRAWASPTRSVLTLSHRL